MFPFTLDLDERFSKGYHRSLAWLSISEAIAIFTIPKNPFLNKLSLSHKVTVSSSEYRS